MCRCVLFMHDLCVLMCVLCYFSFILTTVFAFVFKTMVHCGSAIEPGASGLQNYCTPPVIAPDVIGAKAVWRPKKGGKRKTRSIAEPGASGLPYYCTPPVCVPAVIGELAVW